MVEVTRHLDGRTKSVTGTAVTKGTFFIIVVYLEGTKDF